MRIVFMGTPDFAAVNLKALIDNNYDVVGVFCQPDKAKGRGNHVEFPPVKSLAIENGIPVYQPIKMRDGSAYKIIEEINPDIIVVVAYGKILPEDILNLPKYGTINVHGSLLPKYRGAAPIQWSVLNGDKTTGITTMYLAPEMDTGDMIYSELTEIGEFETSGELFERLSHIGANLLIKTLCGIENNSAPRIPQNNAEATYAPMLDKTMSPIDFNKTPREIVKKIYGLQPWPVATAEIGDEQLKIFAANYTENETNQIPGSIVSAGNDGIEIACAGNKTIMITEVQAPGKKRMSASDYLRGHKI